MLKAIETVYNGYRFRSRLEARWAVFFDSLGIKYEYEKEGYDLNGTWYLPDFWLPEQKCFVEIKGQDPIQTEWNKCVELARRSQFDVCVFVGNVGVEKNTEKNPWHDYCTSYRGHLLVHGSGKRLLCNYIWSKCYRCHRVGLNPDFTLNVPLYAVRHLSCQCFKRGIDDFHLLYDGELPNWDDVSSEDGDITFCNLWSRSLGQLNALENSLRLDIAPYAVCLLDAYTAARQARFEHEASALSAVASLPIVVPSLPLPRTMVVRENTGG